jgi:hypothetical protein
MKIIIIHSLNFIVSTFFSGIIASPVTLLVGLVLKALSLPEGLLAVIINLAEGIVLTYLISLAYHFWGVEFNITAIIIIVVGQLIFGLQRIMKYEDKLYEKICMFSNITGSIISFFFLLK